MLSNKPLNGSIVFPTGPESISNGFSRVVTGLAREDRRSGCLLSDLLASAAALPAELSKPEALLPSSTAPREPPPRFGPRPPVTGVMKVFMIFPPCSANDLKEFAP